MLIYVCKVMKLEMTILIFGSVDKKVYDGRDDDDDKLVRYRGNDGDDDNDDETF